jgi:hypothetical protein
MKIRRRPHRLGLGGPRQAGHHTPGLPLMTRTDTPASTWEEVPLGLRPIVGDTRSLSVSSQSPAREPRMPPFADVAGMTKVLLRSPTV